jgi:hypothetical protein
MTVATDQRIHLSECSQSLIDSRLETIERMLLGRMARSERIAIVREVESQIHELLCECEVDEPSRDDILSVLARLDPPEAYLQVDGPTESPTLKVRGPIRGSAQSTHRGNSRVARASSILGIAALTVLLVCPLLSYLLLTIFSPKAAIEILWAGAGLTMIVCAVLGITLGFYARKSGAWALVGIVTSLLAMIFAAILVAGFALR